MNAVKPHLRIRRALCRLSTVVLLAVVGGGVFAAAAAGQSAADLARWDLRFETVQTEHLAAERALVEARALFDEALARGGNPARAYDLSQQVQNQERRFRQTLEAVTQVRDSLVAALDRRFAYLVNVELQATTTPAAREGVVALATDIQFRLQELERNPPIDERRVAEFSHPVTYDPRDTPTELRQKASRLELRVSQADLFIAAIDERIEVLEGRQRFSQTLRDFSANVGRFDADRLRTGVGGSRPANPREAPVAADSTGHPARTAQEQVEMLRALRETVIQYRDADRQRAIEFRRLASGRSG